MKLPLLPPRGIFVVTALLFDHALPPSVKETLLQILALAWSNPAHETPPLPFSQLASLTGKSATTLHGHITVLRNYRAALRLRRAGHGTLVVSLAEWLYTSAPERRPEEDLEKSGVSKNPEILVNSKEEQNEKERDRAISLSLSVVNIKGCEKSENSEKAENGKVELETGSEVEDGQNLLSAEVSKALLKAGIYSFLYTEVARAGLPDKDLLALLAWCEEDYPERPGGLFMTRLRTGAAAPERYYGERCDVCGKFNGHSETCRRRYTSWLNGRSQ